MSFAALFGASPFEPAEEHAHNLIQGQFGERWEHVPCKKVANRQPQPDPAKRPYGLSGIFDWESEEARLAQETAGVSTRNAEITFRVNDLQYPIVRGDQFVRCKTGDIFEVRDRQKDSASGVVVPVSQFGRQK